MTERATIKEETVITVKAEIPEGVTAKDYLRKLAVDKFYARRITRIAEDTSYAEEGLAKDVDRLLAEIDEVDAIGQSEGYVAGALWMEKNSKEYPVISMGRGTAARFGYLTYALGLSNIDPGKPLMFERFLDPSRGSAPDIDTNFNPKARKKVMKHLTKKYGKKRSLLARIFKR